MLSHPSQVPIHFHLLAALPPPAALLIKLIPDDFSNTWGVQVHGIFDSGKHQEDVNSLKTQQLLCDYCKDGLLE
jgi:hypothetical protein